MADALLRIDVEPSTSPRQHRLYPAGHDVVVTSIGPVTGKVDSTVRVVIEGFGCAPGIIKLREARAAGVEADYSFVRPS